MPFLSKTQIIMAIAALGLAATVLDLVRRRRLSEEYSLLWMVSTVVVAILGFSTPVLKSVPHALGILYESSMVFMIGLAFGTTMLLYLSVRLSRLGREHQAVIREVALLRHELETLAGREAPTPGAGA